MKGKKKSEQFWRDATPEHIATIVRTGKPMKARFRDNEGDAWISGELHGWTIGNGNWYFKSFDNNTSDKYFYRCQVYDPPEWFANKPEPGEGWRLLEKFPPEDLLPTDEAKWPCDGQWHVHKEGSGKQFYDVWYRRRIGTNNPEILDSSTASNTSEISNSCESSPVVKEELKTEHGFQVGDIVRRKQDHTIFAGWVGKITGVEGDGIIVKYLRHTWSNKSKAKNYELVESKSEHFCFEAETEPAPTVNQSLTFEPRFREGDRVIVCAPKQKPFHCENIWSDEMDVYDGKDGFVVQVDSNNPQRCFYGLDISKKFRFLEQFLEPFDTPIEIQPQQPAKTLQRVLYLAGPMRGIAFYNFPMFDRVAAALRDAGYEVINPADEDRKEDNFDPTLEPQFANPAYCVVQPGMDFGKIIRRCFEAVMRCDEIVLLPGWENSVGAIAELFIAVWSGKRIRLVYFEENDQIKFVSVPPLDLATAIKRIQLARNEPKQSEKSDDEDVLDIAARITRGDRQAVYGPPEQDFKKTADMWTGLFQYMLNGEAKFEPRHVAMALICMKMSREFHQRKKDNWVDIAGYARCGSLCE